MRSLLVCPAFLGAPVGPFGGCVRWSQVAAAAASGLAGLDGRPIASATSATALVLLVVWLLLYLRISAPINRAFITAADEHETPANARALQRDCDRIIGPRAILQGLATAALCASLIR